MEIHPVVPQLTSQQFPGPLREYLASLPPLPFNPPPGCDEYLQRASGRQWYQRNQARLQRELAAVHAVFQEGRFRYHQPSGCLIYLGLFPRKVLGDSRAVRIYSYSFVTVVPPEYPTQFPLTWACSVSHVDTSSGLSGPFRHSVRPFIPRAHVLGGNQLCICHYTTSLEGDGWNPVNGTLIKYIPWVARYFANHECLEKNGRWPDDRSA